MYIHTVFESCSLRLNALERNSEDEVELGETQAEEAEIKDKSQLNPVEGK